MEMRKKTWERKEIVTVRVSNQSDVSLLGTMWLAKWDVFSVSVQESGVTIFFGRHRYTSLFPRTIHYPLDLTPYFRRTEHQPSLPTLVTCLITVLVGHPCVPVSPLTLLFLTRTLSCYTSGNIHGPVSFFDFL